MGDIEDVRGIEVAREELAATQALEERRAREYASVRRDAKLQDEK